ncbi:LPS assembly lipoprotein LptE [Thermodesulfobacteriota bacterium]
MGKLFSHCLTFLVVCLLLHGCGYRNPYLSSDDDRGDPVRLHLMYWKNQTNELGLESLIHQKLTTWVIQSKQIKLVASPEEAEMLLQGTILAIEYPGNTFDDIDKARTLKAIMEFSYVLKDAESKKTLLSKRARRETAYAVGKDALFSQSNKKLALQKVADDLSEDIYLRLFYYLTAKH